MKVNVRKKVIIALIMSLIIACITVVSTAASSAGSFVVGNFSGTTNAVGTGAVVKIISAILGVVRTAGAAVAIVILMTIAAKYIMASAGDRADIKKYAVNYIIGALILFGTSGILGIIQNFVNGSVKYS